MTAGREKIVFRVLRLGVAFAFLYPAISAWFSPLDWIGYFPDFMKGYTSDVVLLHLFGATELIIAFWLLSGKKNILSEFNCFRVSFGHCPV